MMTRLLLLGAILCATLPLAAQEAPAAQPAAETVDRGDPAAVAKAYLDACARGDATAALSLATPDKGIELLIKATMSQREVRQGLLQILSEYALLPVPMQAETTAGEPAVGEDGKSATVELTRIATMPSKLVLVQLEEGQWAVDVRASAKATAKGGQSMIAAQAEQMEKMAERGVDLQAPSDNPWQCQSKLREIAQALCDYATEHDGKFPLKDVWMDELLPYLDDGEATFKCPAHPDELHSYAFNEQMSEQKKAQKWEEQKAQVLVACIGTNRANATFNPDDLKTMEPRHGKVNTYCGADQNQRILPGHMTPAEVMAVAERTQECSRRLSQLVSAAKKFAEEHGGFLPSANAWCDELAPYLEQHKPKDGGDPLVCPEFPEAECTYAINEELAGAELIRLVAYRKLLLFIETGPIARNSAVKPGTEGPAKHLSEWNSGSDPFSHTAYLNGSVRSVRPTGKPAGGDEQATAVRE